MALLLRNGKNVVLTSGYRASVFEIGKENNVDLIDNQHNITRKEHNVNSEVAPNGKNVDLIEAADSEDLDPHQFSSKNEPPKKCNPSGSGESFTDLIGNSEFPHIISIDISQSGHYVSMVSSDKKLFVWDLNNLELMNVRNVARKPSRVRFTPRCNEILVADKSGSLYSFPLHDDGSDGKLILAHLSMLLDVVVTPDEKFVITCDRDEKIRVSCWEAPYNIQSFCLGHLEFVSALSFLPSNQFILVSGSGDGTVRFWNYSDGMELKSLHCHTIDGSGDNEKKSLAVKSFSIRNINGKDVLCVCLSEFHGSLVYEIEEQSMQIDIKFMKKITYAAEPFCVVLDNLSVIWSVIPVDGLSVDVECVGLNLSLNDDVKLTLSKINEMKRFLQESLQVPSLIPQLFKKKFEIHSDEADASPSMKEPAPKKVKQSCDEEDAT